MTLRVGRSQLLGEDSCCRLEFYQRHWAGLQKQEAEKEILEVCAHGSRPEPGLQSGWKRPQRRLPVLEEHLLNQSFETSIAPFTATEGLWHVINLIVRVSTQQHIHIIEHRES